MTDQDLREMIRESIARHLGGGRSPAEPASHVHTTIRGDIHSSHVRLALQAGGDADGACLIEPAVPCTHCGYCQSYGH